MKIAVGISGGVDSAVAAQLCKEAGHEVIGVMMKIWDERIPDDHFETPRNACFGPEEAHDIEDAERICKAIGIPLHVIDCVEEFHQRILIYFSTAYLEGKTPNPCIYCNQQLKFGVLPELLLKKNLAIDCFATGHYARVEKTADGRVHLKRARHLSKDQSYFLHRLTHDQLRRTLFPIGNLSKKQVRDIAGAANLDVWDKKESQDFYSGDYRDLIEKEKDSVQQGDIVNTRGEILGKHNGIWNFTVGQRKGLELSGTKRLYVVEIKAESNLVVVGENSDLENNRIVVTDFNQLEELPDELMCKVRSSARLQSCKAFFLDNSRVCIKFDDPVTGSCPGQFAVLYHHEVVIGGGIIEHHYKEPKL